MKFKLADLFLALAVVLNVVSLIFGNQVWRGWLVTGLLIATLILRFMNNRVDET